MLPPEGREVKIKPAPFSKWCRWKPVFRWDDVGKSVTWLIFHVGYVPWWMRRPWTAKERKDFMDSVTNAKVYHVVRNERN